MTGTYGARIFVNHGSSSVSSDGLDMLGKILFVVLVIYMVYLFLKKR